MTIEDLTEEQKAAREAKLAKWRIKEAEAQQELKDQMEIMLPYIERHMELNANIRDLPIYKRPSEEDLKKIEDMGIPAKGGDPKELMDVLVNDVLSYGGLPQHPRFLSYVMSAVSPFSLSAAVLSDVYNLNGASFDFSPAAIVAEEQTLKWMCSRAGFPAETCGGIFVSGGSMANFTGQIAARDNMLAEEDWCRGTAYFSNQTHASTEKGLHMIGLRRDQIRKIDVDDDYRIRVDLLEEAIKEDIAAGKKPFLIIGNLGSTNTGSIDPFDELADLAEKYGMWVHVDGAFGGSMLASDKYRPLAKGIERVDSMAWDGHKWLMQTYSCSTTLVRDKQKLINAFVTHPEYLASMVDEEHTNPWDLGPEMSRPIRGVKLWFTLQGMGTERISELVGKAWHMTKAAGEEFELRPQWKMLSKPSCGTIAFHYVPDGWTDLDDINELNRRISQRTIGSDTVYVAETVLKGKVAMRLCMINVNTTDEDVRYSIEFLDECARKEVELWGK